MTRGPGIFLAAPLRIDSELPVSTAIRRLERASKVLERTPYYTTYLTARVSHARVLVTIEGRNRRHFEFEGSLTPSPVGSSLVGVMRLSRLDRFFVSVWFAFLILGGIHFFYSILTQPPGPAATPTPVAMLIALALIWLGVGVLAYAALRRVIARQSDLIMATIQKALTEPSAGCAVS